MQDKIVQDAISNDEPTTDSEILAKCCDVLFVCFLRKKSEGYVFFLNQLKWFHLFSVFYACVDIFCQGQKAKKYSACRLCEDLTVWRHRDNVSFKVRDRSAIWIMSEGGAAHSTQQHNEEMI